MKKKALSFFISIILALSLLPQSALAVIDASTALGNTITGYYQGSQNSVLDDWEELAAVYAYEAGNDYVSGVDLTDYVLPATPASGSSAVFAYLMKGDAASAQTAAEGLVSGTSLTIASDAFNQALNMLAVEAYNRSIDPDITYDKSAAVADLLSFKEANNTFLSWGEVSYDTSGLALAALSCYAGIDDEITADVASEIANIKAALKNGQDASAGGFASFWAGIGTVNANTTACALMGLTALGEDLQTDWSTTAGNLTPLDALLSFNVDGGGFDWSSNVSANDYATKQATLALAEQVNGISFFKNLVLNTAHYISVTVQVVKSDESFVEKDITLNISTATLDDTAARTIGISSVAPGDYIYYKDGVQISDISSVTDGDVILAVYKDFSDIAYFSYADSDIGAASPTVSFGSSVELMLNKYTLGGSTVALANIPVDINGDSYGDISTAADGTITVTPIEASTDVEAIKSDYYGTYIGASVAVLPARITMSQGSAQSATVCVRVEGKDSNVLYYSAFDATNDGSSRLTVFDAVTQALGASGVSFTAGGGYISSIGGTSAGSSSSMYDGWLYMFNGAETWVGMDSQLIDNSDEILLYYGYSLGYGTDTAAISSQRSGNDVAVTVTGSSAVIGGVLVTLTDTQDSSNIFSGTTDLSGSAALINVPSGTYYVEINKTDADGVPEIIRLAPNTTITVTDGGTSQDPGTGSSITSKKVYIAVYGPSGYLLSHTDFPWFVGITPFSALMSTGLDVTGSAGYVSDIEGVSEFDYGANSGWLFKVNGNENITQGAADYQLSENDELVWFYTTDFTSESGSDSWNNDKDDDEEENFEIPFFDINEDNWFYDAVATVTRLGLFNGESGTSFGADRTMTRAMFATVLGRLFELGGNTASASGNSIFSDVESEDYYADYVSWAFENGIITGYGDVLFGSGDSVTREQIAVFMYRYAEFMGIDMNIHGNLNSFSDSEYISDWAQDAINWAVGAGLLTGRGNGILDPSGAASRAEAAAVFARFLDMINA